jgi:hypothetical protein
MKFLNRFNKQQEKKAAENDDNNDDDDDDDEDILRHSNSYERSGRIDPDEEILG